MLLKTIEACTYDYDLFSKMFLKMSTYSKPPLVLSVQNLMWFPFEGDGVCVIHRTVDSEVY